MEFEHDEKVYKFGKLAVSPDLYLFGEVSRHDVAAQFEVNLAAYVAEDSMCVSIDLDSTMSLREAEQVVWALLDDDLGLAVEGVFAAAQAHLTDYIDE